MLRTQSIKLYIYSYNMIYLRTFSTVFIGPVCLLIRPAATARESIGDRADKQRSVSVVARPHL